MEAQMPRTAEMSGLVLVASHISCPMYFWHSDTYFLLVSSDKTSSGSRSSTSGGRWKRLQRHLLCLTDKLILMHTVLNVLLLVTEDGSFGYPWLFYIPGIQSAHLASVAH